MRDIDTKLLRSFLAVATEKSFSTAAERLECSQGTMSVRIQLLEEQVGDRLFDRGRHNVKITAAGQDLLPHAQALVDMHDRLIDRAAARRVSGRVRLGVGEDHGSELFSRLRRHLDEGYDAIELDIVCRSCRVLAEETLRGALDLAIVTSLEEIRPGTRLSRRRLHWVAARDFTFDENAPLPVACFPEGCSLRESGLAALKGRNIAWRVALCSPSEEVIRDAVSAGAAITVMTEGTVPGDLKAVVRPSLLPPPRQGLDPAAGEARRTDRGGASGQARSRQRLPRQVTRRTPAGAGIDVPPLSPRTCSGVQTVRHHSRPAHLDPPEQVRGDKGVAGRAELYGPMSSYRSRQPGLSRSMILSFQARGHFFSRFSCAMAYPISSNGCT